MKLFRVGLLMCAWRALACASAPQVATATPEAPEVVVEQPKPAPTIERADPPSERSEASSERARSLRLVLVEVDPAHSMSPRELVTDGDRHFHAGDFEEAAAYFFTAARRRPSDPVARLALGHVLSPLGFYDEATDSITRGMALFAASRGSRGPTWGEMKVDLRGFYASRRRFALQLRQLETWVDENARDVKATFLLAYTYYFSGRRSDAKKLFRRALALDPDFDEALYFLRLLGALEMT